MNSIAASLFILALGSAHVEPSQVDTLFVKVGPMPSINGRSADQRRAVVLIHGLGLHVIHKERTYHAYLRPWQQSDHPLIRQLAQDSDVYALSYSQNVKLEEIAKSKRVLERFRNLRKDGYEEIVLIGHSAGGLIAKELVEDNPKLGITKVIQVCSPNEGSGWAALKTAGSAQLDFLLSLTKSRRQEILNNRYPLKRIPVDVQFACVVGSCNLRGDGVVSYRSQWSRDLQSQGIPAYRIKTTHWDAMSNRRTLDLLQRLVTQSIPRLDESGLQETARTILGK